MNKYKYKYKFTLLLSLFITLILTTGMSNPKEKFNGKIFKNIYIEKINIGKMNINEAKEVINNKQRIKSTLNLVNEAVNDAANTVANYQDSHDR